MVETVQDNINKFTKREVEKAHEAKRLFNALGKPALKDFIDIIRHNRIKNCPVTTQDISRAITYGEGIWVLYKAEQ